jgi:uncharacterized protein YjbJ (UPF0337 family)
VTRSERRTGAARPAPKSRGTEAALNGRMNWTRVERKWNKFAGEAKAEWDKLTDDDLKYVAGKKDVLVDKLKQHYGIVKEDAEGQVDAWLAKLSAKRAEQSAKNAAAR